MKNLNKYNAVIDSKISGIPCKIGVTEYECVEGNYSFNAVSDWDYSGYSNVDFDILDRKGYTAHWLERKLTEKETDRLISEIHNYFQ